jgi:hypothetical protein
VFGVYSESADGLRRCANAGIGGNAARRGRGCGRGCECGRQILNVVDRLKLYSVAGSEAFTLVLSTRAADGAAGRGDAEAG